MKACERARCWCALALLVALTACSSTTLTGRWSDSEYSGGPLNRILVIGRVENEVDRRVLEEGFTERLAEHGAAGVASYRLMPNPEDADNQQQLTAIVARAGVDGFLIVRLKGVDKRETAVPPTMQWFPATGFAGYYGYFGGPYWTLYQPGYIRIDRVMMLETSLFSGQTGEMLWAGNTDSLNPDSVNDLVPEIADIIVGELEKSGLIHGTNGSTP